MAKSAWDATSIYAILEAPRIHDFQTDITVLQIDEEIKVVIGYRNNGSVFFGCPQIGEITGFRKGRAELETSQTIDLKERGLIEPALALSFLVDSEEELRAISTIFSGLYDLNRNANGKEKATMAAQGFEDYFADLPRIGLTDELEIGLFGELCILAASTKKEELVRRWHPAPDSTYDFAYGSNRLEVKTSTRPSRMVWLRSSQTIRNAVPRLTYLSVYAPYDEAGVDLRTLSSQISDSLVPQLRKIFAEKLDFYDLENCIKRFDYQTAIESFRFISSRDIPTPSVDDPRILEIQWKCSFGDLPTSSDTSSWI